jgi:hypothetical protein
MDTTEFLNTNARFKESRLHARTFLCTVCGTLVRAKPPSISGSASKHCAKEMTLLSYEQSVAATQLEPKERSFWIAGGGSVKKVGGKRQWRPE